ncbi:MAG: bifunctional folylpolyglutamate synthase/dihydrofolate synthase [Acidimicrobiales bacterium]|nr:bifunctional folylpolyglutamate synthase/dihydrofolate synthase [Acidimicrobiales bacterium]MCB9394275.1 bifunctional folylpolyglutamate synthase/dihydrofolate synthase [Acidimicrobiaceae bacterium]
MNYTDALAYLDDHASYDTTGRVESPTIERISRLMDVSGEPHRAYPVIHITGTNGKGSTTQMITRLLMAQGLTVGTYTSPHLERLNERISRNAEPIGDEEFAEQIASLAEIEIVAGVRPTYFELVTAAAFRWFADVAVDVAVVEVGMLGTWDATNVVDAQVAVVTNIGMDHNEYAGPTTTDIAREKSGIVKPGSAVVIGETDPDLARIFAQAGGASSLQRGVDFDVVENQLALGGRLVDLRTPTTIYPEVFVPLHGRHQADNAAVALTAVEAFFAAPLSDEVVREGFADVVMPGRFEVIGHQPLVIVDGAHNAAGADVAAQVFFDDFDPAGMRYLVVGCLKTRDVRDLLGAVRADEFDVVLTCTAPSPRGLASSVIAAAAAELGCDEVIECRTTEEACAKAVRLAGGDDAILVTGSLYVVGAARPALRDLLP